MLKYLQYIKSDYLSEQNFRIVSILTCISKMFESLMSDQMVKGMLDQLSHLLSAHRKAYSCEHVLIKAVEDWETVRDTVKM